MNKFILILLLCFQIGLQAEQDTIQLSNYTEIAIATDLEPDDLLALKIIFNRANQIYATHPEKGYPIQLVVVGEGNSAIKQQRMECLLKLYLDLPQGIHISVKRGHSTQDNLFPYDGEEFPLGMIENNLPWIEDDEGSAALVSFVHTAERPLIIQLKPLQELMPLAFSGEAGKATLVIYGGFNLRKTVLDAKVLHDLELVPGKKLSDKLSHLVQLLTQKFSRVAILESYAVLGEQSSVYKPNHWTGPIAHAIQHAQDPFYRVFENLITHWNRYLFEAELIDLTTSLKGYPSLQQQLVQLIAQWDAGEFASLLKQIEGTALEAQFQFAKQVQPSSDLQFTLADALVALALTDPSFTFQPVKLQVSDRGFLQPLPDPTSNLFYYRQQERTHVRDLLLHHIQ